MRKIITLLFCCLIAIVVTGQVLTPKQRNGKWGFINSRGQVVIGFQYDASRIFSEGLAAVRLNNKWGYINTNGRVVVGFRYDESREFNEGLAAVRLNNKWGYIDTDGKVVIGFKYDASREFNEGLADVRLNNKWGYIDTNDRIVIGFEYDESLPFNNGLAFVKLNDKWGYINTNGDWFDSKKTGEQWQADVSFSSYAKNYVEQSVNAWQKKGEFEKTSDWQKRVNEQTRNQKISELTKEAERQFIKEYSEKRKLNYSLEQYDADNEVYLIMCDNRSLLVPVPIAEAPDFKKYWDKVIQTPKYFIENDRLAVAEVTFCMPDGKTYKYSNNASLNYTVAQIDYNFDPIEIEASPEEMSPTGRQNISTVNVAVGKSDVDINIPQNGMSNDRTFAVIIANENYSKLSRVPFALNDGKMFGEYCRRTLGLPQSNIRYYGDATYGTMLAAVKDIEKIAKAYNGDIKVIFYYAGHGAPDEGTQEAYLLPVDAYGVNSEACYSLDRLYGELGALGARNVVVFLDACFSGSTREGSMLASARGVAIKPKNAVPMGNMVVFTAAQGDETALPYKEKNHGMFTYYLLKKLQETQGNVTFSELGEYITGQVRQRSQVVNRKSQTPTVLVSPALLDSWAGLLMR